MKKSSVLIIVAAFILSSCGAITQIASSDNGQRFQDGIYSNTPSFRTKAEKAESQSESQALAHKTKESQIYLFGDKKDTVAIPQDMSAMIRYDQKLGGTVVTVGENPYDWRYDLENNYGYYYGPYSIGSSWYWSRHYSPWYSWDFAPWRYHGWYDGWHFGSWYSPYYYGGYYGGWYDPWYWGSHWGWYDPWYSPYYNPYYCGWYGGWDPYYHGIHFRPPYGGHHLIFGNTNGRGVYRGSRHTTSSNTAVVSGSRTPSKDASGTVRKTSTTSRSSFGTSRSAASRSATGRSTTTYRKPTTGSTSRSPESSGSSYNRGTTRSSSGTTPSYNRGSGYSTSPGSSYNRSSSGGSYSGGGYSGGSSRSGGSSHGGGGYSRSSSGSRR